MSVGGRGATEGESTGRPATGGFRPELQGLRAVAALLVITYHLWFNRVSGGVDVFFVITGFLLTGQLVRAAERGSIDVVRRWGRSLSRLVPPMAVVLVATAVAAVLILPEGRWPQTARELAASIAFVENWALAFATTDYSSSNDTATVVQHFWSLAIQGQVFLAWPLLAALVAASARMLGVPVRAAFGVAMATVFVASLAWSIHLTGVNQPLAYFHTLTRLWEFAAGGLLALLIHRITLPVAFRVVAGWVGLVGLLVCGFVLDVTELFPGVAALWPVSCAVLVLVAGATGWRGAADRLLTLRPVRYLGDLSFALYLWHWPLLVLFLVSTGSATVTLTEGIGIVALSLALAALTFHLVERPVADRRLPAGLGYGIAATSLAIVLIVSAAWQVETGRRASGVVVASDATHPGAVALRDGPVEAASFMPSAVTIYDDWVPVGDWDCQALQRFAADRCTQPVAFEPTRRVVVVGDSHIQQLAGALVPIAERQGWQLTFMLRGACPFSTASEVNPDDTACVEWNEAAAAEIIDLAPDVVVTLASRNVRVGLTEETPDGFVERWRTLETAGIRVIAVRDNPRFDSSMPDCVELSEDVAACGVARDDVYATDPPWTLRDDLPTNVGFLDVSDLLCDGAFCPAVVGNVLVYMDDNHLTATYTTTMADFVEERILAELAMLDEVVA